MCVMQSMAVVACSSACRCLTSAVLLAGAQATVAAEHAPQHTEAACTISY